VADDSSDHALLTRATAGDERAFASLYERHRGLVFRFAYRMLGSAEAAEDIAHDCFLALLRQPLRFDPARASLRTYLCAAVRNLSIRRLRRDGREVTDEVRPDAMAEATALQGLLDHEVASEVRAAVAALPPLQREVVILVEYEDCALTEAAEIVGADVGTVKARLHRARQALRRRLAPLRGQSLLSRQGDVR
jgi:RNA polymerase sigma-70 factor (ECF subfamily)